MKNKIFKITMIPMFMVVLVNGANYYVSNNGNNSNPGSKDMPLKTIAFAVTKAGAGDTIFLREGTYPETFYMTSSGTSEENRIVLSNYGNEKVLITGDGTKGWSCWVSGSWITIQGINFKCKNPWADDQVNNMIIRGNHVTVYQCNFVDTNPQETWKKGAKVNGIKLEGTLYTIIDGCTLTGLCFHGINVYQSSTSPSRYWIIRNTTSMGNYANGIMLASSFPVMIYGLVQNCTLGGSLVSDGFQSNGDYKTYSPPTTWGVILDNNIIYGSAENGIDIKGARYFFMQNNIIYQNVGDNNGFQEGVHDHNGGFGGITHGSNTYAYDMVIRGNIIYSTNGAIQLFPRWIAYNNTILGNNRDFSAATSSFNFTASGSKIFSGIYSYNSGIQVLNNILGGHLNCDMYITNHSSNKSDYNLFANDIVASPRIGYSSSATGVSLDNWKSVCINQGKDAHSFVADPKLVNATSRPTEHHTFYDFTPSSESPAIDAAGPLTLTVDSGANSTSVIVASSNYFHGSSGWSEIGVPGDKIMVGGVEVVIDSIQGDTLHLDRSISWSVNDPVFLCPNGDCPDNGLLDIGAIQADGNWYSVLSIQTTTLPDAFLNEPYSVSLIAEGGTVPYIWSITYDSLPKGLSLDTLTGIISGTPGEYGQHNFIIRVKDSDNSIASLQFDLNVTYKVGVNQNILENEGINIYPNPVHSSFTITGKQDFNTLAQVEIYTLQGKKLYQTSDGVTFPFQLDISSFHPGIYIARISDGDKHIMKKVAKE